MDGGSTDGSLDVIKSYNGRISSLHSQIDHGMYDALNRGIKLATGDVIGFVHSDDLLADDMVISDVVKRFEETNADLVYGDIVYVSKQDTEKVVRYWKSGEYKSSRMRFGWMPPHTGLYVRKTVYEDVKLPNGMYFDTKLQIASDYDFMLRVFSREYRTVYLPRVLTRMRLGGVSNSGIGNIIIKSLEDYRALRRHSMGGVTTLLSKNVRKLPQFIAGERAKKRHAQLATKVEPLTQGS
jgi:glycosyltransferase